MKCPHCGVSFHDNWRAETITRNGEILSGWRMRNAHCPGCSEYTIELGRVLGNNLGIDWKMVHPESGNRGPTPTSVPSDIAEDYVEACNVLPISPKASAALSRRCLQSILRAHGYKAKDLAKEVDLLLNETDPMKAIPQSIREAVDSIRNFGNFSAHPISDITSLQIIDVEPEEAEWCLEILEELFQHYYERPAQAASRKAALNAKLIAAGKPLAK
jgi:hypothetical protein